MESHEYIIEGLQKREERVNERQKEAIVEFMLSHPQFGQQKLLGPQGKQVSRRLWQELSDQLNALGPNKQVAKWQRVWTDLKNNVKKKASSIRKHRSGTGRSVPTENVALSALEEKVLSLLRQETVFEIASSAELALDSEEQMMDPPHFDVSDETQRLEGPQRREERMNERQKVTIVEFMLSHPQFRQQKLLGPQGKQVSRRLWHELANQLNALGPSKKVAKWQRAWTDLKNNVKKKANSMRKHRSGTGSGPRENVALSSLEDKVLSLLSQEAVCGIACSAELSIDSGEQKTMDPLHIDFSDETQRFEMTLTDTEDVGVSSISGGDTDTDTDVEEPSMKKRRKELAMECLQVQAAASNNMLREINGTLKQINSNLSSLDRRFEELTNILKAYVQKPSIERTQIRINSNSN